MRLGHKRQVTPNEWEDILLCKLVGKVLVDYIKELSKAGIRLDTAYAENNRDAQRGALFSVRMTENRLREVIESHAECRTREEYYNAQDERVFKKGIDWLTNEPVMVIGSEYSKFCQWTASSQYINRSKKAK